MFDHCRRAGGAGRSRRRLIPPSAALARHGEPVGEAKGEVAVGARARHPRWSGGGSPFHEGLSRPRPAIWNGAGAVARRDRGDLFLGVCSTMVMAAASGSEVRICRAALTRRELQWRTRGLVNRLDRLANSPCSRFHPTPSGDGLAGTVPGRVSETSLAFEYPMVDREPLAAWGISAGSHSWTYAATDSPQSAPTGAVPGHVRRAHPGWSTELATRWTAWTRRSAPTTLPARRPAAHPSYPIRWQRPNEQLMQRWPFWTRRRASRPTNLTS